VTRDEFTALPPLVALGIVYDMAQAKLEPMPVPALPRKPKYDSQFTRKGGHYCWVSEMTLDDIIFWRGKKAEGVAAGGQYAESDQKWLVRFDAWIAWRRLYPNECWFGIRGEERVNAAPPSRDAKLHKWGPRKEASGGSEGASSAASPDDDGRASSDDEFAF
jgi:hypothetical protein